MNLDKNDHLPLKNNKNVLQILWFNQTHCLNCSDFIIADLVTTKNKYVLKLLSGSWLCRLIHLNKTQMKGTVTCFLFDVTLLSWVAATDYLDINAIVHECLCTVVDKKLFILLFCNLWYFNVGIIIMNINIIIVFRGISRLAIFLTI